MTKLRIEAVEPWENQICPGGAGTGMGCLNAVGKPMSQLAGKSEEETDHEISCTHKLWRPR